MQSPRIESSLASSSVPSNSGSSLSERTVVMFACCLCPAKMERAEQVMPWISVALAEQSMSATLSTEGEKVFLAYASLAAGSGHVRPVVMLEFGARSTGEPW